MFEFLMVVSMVIWGGSWVTGKAVAGTFQSETLTFWRFVLNTAALLPVVFFLKGPIRLRWKDFLLILLGAACMGLYLYFFFIGLSVGLSGKAGVLVTTMIPVMTCALSLLLLRRKTSAKEIAGLGLGVAGGVVLLEVWTLDAGRIITGGNVYFLACSFLWAVLTICGDRVGDRVSPLLFSILTNVFAAVIFFFASMHDRRLLQVFDQGGAFWFSMLYLSVISSAFATTVYFYASVRLSSYRASSFVFIVPLSALLLSWMIRGEAPRGATVIGGLLGVSATYIINTGRGAGK